MTDLLDTIPDFPIKPYTHLLPSLEKYLVTTSDLLTLDESEIAKRAQLPLLDVRRLTNHVVRILQKQLGLGGIPDADEQQQAAECLRKSGREITNQWSTISTLDDSLDRALGGGIPTGYLTEIVGERYFTTHHVPRTTTAHFFTSCQAVQARLNSSLISCSLLSFPLPMVSVAQLCTSQPSTPSQPIAFPKSSGLILYSLKYLRPQASPKS